MNWCGHRYGYKNFDNGDQSRNTLVFDVLTSGELFQNDHHNVLLRHYVSGDFGLKSSHGFWSETFKDLFPIFTKEEFLQFIAEARKHPLTEQDIRLIEEFEKWLLARPQTPPEA